jgi:hypothetical protein
VEFVAGLAPADVTDPVIEAYKEGVDRTLVRENLKLTHGQRLQKLQRTAAVMIKWRGAAQRSLEHHKENRDRSAV